MDFFTLGTWRHEGKKTKMFLQSSWKLCEKVKTAVTHRQCFYCGRPVWWVTQGNSSDRTANEKPGWVISYTSTKTVGTIWGREMLFTTHTLAMQSSCARWDGCTSSLNTAVHKIIVVTYCLLTFFIFKVSFPTLTASPNTTCTHVRKEFPHLAFTFIGFALQ